VKHGHLGPVEHRRQVGEIDQQAARASAGRRRCSQLWLGPWSSSSTRITA
jgi:hypothetical protein